MEKLQKHVGVAAPLPLINIDTDMIIPKQFLKTIKRTGLGRHLFFEMRQKEDGSENPDFILNRPAYRNATILIVGDNFGCGSSREHAPWALLDYGFRVLISTGFADIFYNNCFKNGILPITVPSEEHKVLMKYAENGANARLEVDLEAQTVSGLESGPVMFAIDPHRKYCLLNGLDDIGLSLEKMPLIQKHEEWLKSARPWLCP